MSTTKEDLEYKVTGEQHPRSLENSIHLRSSGVKCKDSYLTIELCIY